MKPRHLRTRTFAAVSLLALAANATPTDWDANSSHSRDVAADVLRSTNGANGKLSDSLDMLVEFPVTEPGGGFGDANAVHLYPKKVENSAPITELNNAATFCPAVGDFVEAINETSNGVVDLLTVAVDGAIQIAEVISDRDSFVNENGDAFEKVAEVEASISVIEDAIALMNGQLASIQDSVDEIEGVLEPLHASFDAAHEASLTGVPNTPEAQQLQGDVADLEDDIADLQAILGALPPASQAAIQAMINAKQAELDAKSSQLDALSAAFRAQKAAEAASLQAQIDDLQGSLDELNADRLQLVADKADKTLELSDVRDDDEYIAALATLNQFDLLLAHLTDLQADFRQFRQPLINDAMLGINFAKLNFNDLAGLTAGSGNAQFNMGAGDLATGTNAVSAAGVAAQSGTMYNVKLATTTGELLNSPPFRFSLFRLDPDSGLVSPLPSPVGIDAPQTFAGWDKYNVSFSGGVTPRVVPLPLRTTWKGVSRSGSFNAQASLNLPSGVPQAQVQIGLGTYCGNVTQSDVPATNTTSSGLQLDLLRSVLTFTPRPQQRRIFSTPVHGSYDVEALMKPDEARCNVDISDYEAMTHSWGKVEKWGFFYHSIRRWDDSTQTSIQNDGFNCTFINPSGSAHADEVRAFNQMALAEAYAQFLKASTIELSTPVFNYDEIDEYKRTYPRYTWSPSMMSICRGEPICVIGGKRFKSKAEFTNAGTTSFSGRLEIHQDTRTQVAYTRILPRTFEGSFSFQLQ